MSQLSHAAEATAAEKAAFQEKWKDAVLAVFSKTDIHAPGVKQTWEWIVMHYRTSQNLFLADPSVAISALEVTKRLVLEYNKSLSTMCLFAQISVIILINEIKSPLVNHKKTDRQVIVDIERLYFEIQEAIAETAQRQADQAKSKKPSFHELIQWHEVIDHAIGNYAFGCITSFLKHLPHGKEGTAAYRYLLELRLSGLKEKGRWQTILRDLLAAPSDKRRVSELVLGQCSRGSDTIKALDKDEREHFLHHAADGVSPVDVWAVISRDDLQATARREHTRMGGMGGRGGRHGGLHGRGNRTRNDLAGAGDYGDMDDLMMDGGGRQSLVGRWDTSRDPEKIFKFKLREERRLGRGLGGDMDDDDLDGLGGAMRAAMFGSDSYQLELQLSSGKTITAEVKPNPQPMHGRGVMYGPQVADYYCDFRSSPQEPPQALLFNLRRGGRTVRLDVYLRDIERGQIPLEIHGIPHWSLTRDELSDERAVTFAARLLREVLLAPPADDLQSNLTLALRDISGLGDELQHQISRIGLRRINPATLMVVFTALDTASKLFSENGWLVTQAERTPCVNLLSVFGLVLEHGHVLSRYPSKICDVLDATGKAETARSKDPLSVLQVINRAACHDFDGTWTWMCGLDDHSHANAFKVCGHTVQFLSPGLSSAVLKSITYEEEGIRFSFTFDKPPDRQDVVEWDDGPREVCVTVELNKPINGVHSGRWMRDDRHKWKPSTFDLTIPPVVRTECEWGREASRITFPQLAERISAWTCESFDNTNSTDWIKKIFPQIQHKASDEFYVQILRLWKACCQQIIKKASASDRSLHALDNWVLAVTPGKSLVDFTDKTRKEAAKILLEAYAKQRPVRWNSVPVSLVKLQTLAVRYDVVKPFIDVVTRETTLLRSNLTNRKISFKSYQLTTQYMAIYADNKLSFPQNLNTDSFRVPRKELDKTLQLYRELTKLWGVVEDTRRMQDIESKIRESDLVDLCDLESTVEDGKRMLGPAWTIQDAALSPLLRAHFVHCSPKGKEISVKDLESIFAEAKRSLAAITLKTPVGVAVANLDPLDGDLQGARRKQEVDLLGALGVSREVSDALVDGALAYRYMVNDLASFRMLAQPDAPRDLRLQPNFLNKKEETLLLSDDLDSLPLGEARQRCADIRDVTGGCRHDVLEIVRTMLNCEKIVEFTRDHPQAQDEGLANVLANARDLQHASFQTFLNCVSYINPFVSASAAHKRAFEERRKLLEEEAAEQGDQQVITTDDVVRAAHMRAPINNRTSEGTTLPDGFWDLLNTNFASHVNVRQIQANLERVNTAEQVEGLEKMIKEQNGTTDRLIAHCRAACGLPPAEDDEDAGEQQMQVDPEPSLVVIELPPTGTPLLQCEFGGKLLSGAEYQDAVYRATLQRSLDEALDLFRTQAREVLRTYNTACALFNEGHIEFRSRKITFRHDKGGHINQMLRALVGQWSSVSGTTVSVFREACTAHPALSCVTPAELVRMAELMRGVCSAGDLTAAEAERMVLPWRENRCRHIRRNQQSAVVASEANGWKTSTVFEPKPTVCLAVNLPERKPLLEDGVPLVLENCGEASGRYTRGLWMYKRVDGAVLAPVSQGWAVYSANKFDSTLMLASSSENDGVLAPWGMDGWHEPDTAGLLGAAPSSNVRVQIDGAYAEQRVWSSDAHPLTQQVVIQSPDDVPSQATTVTESGSVFIGKVERYSLWESMGFERGTKILSISTSGGDEVSNPQALAKFLASEAKREAKAGFSVELQSPWIWTPAACPTSMDISANGRGLTKMRGTQGALAFSLAPAISCTWRILVEGDLAGARVGLCSPSIDNKSSDADSAVNKPRAYWFLRLGVLRHNGRDVAITKAFKAGDVITVTHSYQDRSISFKLNDTELGAQFTGVEDRDLRPCVFLKAKGATATLSNGAPLREVLKWDSGRINSSDIQVSPDGTKVSRKNSGAQTCAAIGGSTFRGPGPHKFRVRLTGKEKFDKVHVGVAPPSIALKEKVKDGSKLFGMSIVQTSDSCNIYNLQEPTKVAHTCKLKQPTQTPDAIRNDASVVYSFTLDLGEGSIDVIRNNDRLVHTATIPQFPHAEGPLVPYVLFEGASNNTEVELLPAEESKTRGESSPSVVIRGSSDPKTRASAAAALMRSGPSQKSNKVTPVGPADGLYERWLPTYVRSDGAYQMFFWGGRWCVADPAERPVAWTSVVNPDHPLGSTSLKWSVVASHRSAPEYVRIVTPNSPGGLLTLQKSKKADRVWYASRDISLLWSRSVRRWVVVDSADASSETPKAYYSSSICEKYPHLCTTWHWGDGSSWSADNRIRIQAYDGAVQLRHDSRGLAWSKQEWGGAAQGWDAAPVLTTTSALAVPQPAIDIETNIREADKKALDAYMMTADELAGWHIIRKACVTSVSATDLRKALLTAAKGSNSGIELIIDWASTAEAQQSVRKSALAQLHRIGNLLKAMSSSTNTSPLVASALQPQNRYGQVVGRPIEGAIVDTSRIAVADRKLFGLSLFNKGLKSYHVLDCSEHTLDEDVTAFIFMFQQLQQGRMVALHLQELGSEARNMVRVAIEENEANSSSKKELLAVVTGGDGTDETIESVDSSACDQRWRRWALGEAETLRHFKTITHYAQGAGEGKSFAIEESIKEGEWGGTEEAPVNATRLDLDSTVESMHEVCERLMSPLREPKGLLLVHVGHDTSPAIVNRVLDSLIFFGRIQSNSGLSVSLHSNAWHLVVEFQRPPAPEVGHTVNPPWISKEGSSDITILACPGLAKAGKLKPYKPDTHKDATSMLKFLRMHVQGVRSVVEDDILVRMLSLGLNKAPAKDSDEYGDFLESLEGLSARFLTRALKYAIKKFRRFQPSDTPSNKTLSGTSQNLVVAEGIIHEMGHFVTPTKDDHYHVICEAGDIKKYTDHMLLSGKVPRDMETALDKMWQDIERNLRAMTKEGVSIPRVERGSQDAPFYRLLEMLCDEVAVDTKLAIGCLREKSYVLIPDFLQKLIQLSTHLDLNDPAILEGPSGTGKSYAIMILSELMHLPTKNSVSVKREGFKDLQSTMNVWVRIDRELKMLFPDNEADIKINNRAVVWSAEHIKPYQNVLDCLDKLVERKNAEGLNYVREGLLECVGPCVKDEASYPDVAKQMQKSKDMRAAVPILFSTDSECKDIRWALEALIRDLSRVSGGFLSLEMVQQMEARLRSEKMKELAGSLFDDFLKTLAQRHKYEAVQAWARTVVPHLRGKGERLTRIVKEKLRDEIRASPILKVPPELMAELADPGQKGVDGKQMGEALAKTIAHVVDLKREPTTTFILMRYDMTPDDLFSQLEPTLRRAVECPKIRFMVMIDEMNATKMLGLIKRLVVDRYWAKWETAHPPMHGSIPENVSFVGAVNPSKKSRLLEGVTKEIAEDSASGAEALGFDVTPMPPSLQEHVVPWRQLAEGQRDMFTTRLIKQSKNLFSADIRPNQVEALSRLLLLAHTFAQRKMQNKRSTVSQRDIHRTMKLFDFFFKQGRDFTLNGDETTSVWNKSLSGMLLGIACSYYFRFPPDDRAELSNKITELLETLSKESQDPEIVANEADRNNIPPLPADRSFAAIVQQAVEFFCNKKHLHLPDAVYAHQGLMENLFVQMVAFDIRLAVILEGAPGTSKTLSNNVIRDNMTGSGEFWKDLCHISHICRYQGSAQSSGEEIKKKCVEAYEKQRENDDSGARNKRALLFVDEAGLVRGEDDSHKWALKVLHYYLEGANLASVLMTNATLDPAIGNRCLVVYMAKPAPEELTNMCAGILHNRGMAGLSPEGQKVVPKLCKAFHVLVPPLKEGKEELVSFDKNERFRWWYGLRDLFHLMRYVRRNQDSVTCNKIESDDAIYVDPEIIARALERNMNGPPDFFDKVLRVYGSALADVHEGYSTANLKKLLRPNLETILDSIQDNNRATEGSSGKNLNDMWVRFKLLVDTTEDGSMLQLLRQMEIPCFKDISVLSLSALSKGDRLMPVTVVSQIVAAMETGKTVWLTNTREIDACLFDVFNQNYVVSCSGSNEVNHFVPIAIGAALEYKQVHRKFQCIVHVTKKELGGMGNVLPSPFLNRLEKFALHIEDIVQYKMHEDRLYPDHAQELKELRENAEKFEKSLSLNRGCSLFTASPKETIGSLMLEAIDGKKVSSVKISRRIKNDEALQPFIFGGSAKQSRWRKTACKVLQICQLDHMLLAQRVLKEFCPAYLRAYFRDLAPWSITRYLSEIQAQVREPTEDKLWLRSVAYSPANVDFPSLLERIKGVRHKSIDNLLDSERGHDDLQDDLHRFCLDDTASVFVVVVGPESLGNPETREVRLLLDAPPELKPQEKEKLQNKAVVILQGYQCQSLTGANACTPLFGTGWDQVWIDASGEHLACNMLEYVEPSVVGKLPTAAAPEWADIEPLVDTAMTALMQAQLDASKKWAEVGNEDPASALYDMKRPFGEQVAVAHKLLNACPKLKRALVKIYKERIPSHLDLVEMAGHVAGQEKSQSLPQRLEEERRKAPVALLMFALRFLLDDRNASALLQLERDGEKERLVQSDTIIAHVFEIAAASTTFHLLRHMNVSSMQTLVIRATTPRLPGSSSLMDTLTIPATATDAAAEAKKLQMRHKAGAIGALVDLVQKDSATVLAFFEDSVRARVKYNNPRVVAQVVPWVLRLSRGLHAELFGGAAETVWSVRALCCVEAAAIDDYILAMVPLAAMDILATAPSAPFEATQHAGSWVSHELGPKLLVDSFEAMTKQENGLSHFCSASASMLRRSPPEAYSASRCLPTIAVLSGMLSGDVSDALVKDALKFAKVSPKIAAPALAIDLKLLSAILDTHEKKVAVARICVELAKLHQATSGKHAETLVPFVLGQMMQGRVPRAMCVRVLSHLHAKPSTLLESAEGRRLAKHMFDAACTKKKADKLTKPPLFQPPCMTPNAARPGKTTKNLPIYENAVYLALFDACYDEHVGLSGEHINPGGATDMAKLLNKLMPSGAEDADVAHARGVLVRASEIGFLQYLAAQFQRPVKSAKNWAPSVMEEPEKVKVLTETSKRLLEPPGFKCPAYTSTDNFKLTQNFPSPDHEYNSMILLHALEHGVGKFRGMGRQSLLGFLQDQVVPDTGALVKVCGEALRMKCQNSSPLQTGPGDLPFVSEPSNPLFLRYMVLVKKLGESVDARSNVSEGAKMVVEEVVSWEDHSLEQKRLVVFYACYKVFFGARHTCPYHAELLASDLPSKLQLNEQQKRVLQIILDRESLTRGRAAKDEIGLTDTLLRGGQDGWTEVIMTALVVACADPNTLLGSYFFNIDVHRKHFIPGDKTGGDISHGGGYKIDCVTQLDLNGDLAAYARGQTVLSAGACYLLWCLSFGAWAMQLTLFKDKCYDTCSNWLVSGTIKARTHSYQRNHSDYQHLTNQFAERSIAYHLHLGAHTGLTVDEAQAAYAMLIWRFADSSLGSSDVMRRLRCATRTEALQVERNVQDLWQLSCSNFGAKKKASDSASTEKDCHTLADTRRFAGECPKYLCRCVWVYTELERMAAQKVPKLLSMALHDKDKLSLLAPLLTEVYNFSLYVHRMLSHALPVMSPDANGDEVKTAYQSVLSLFEKHTPPSQHQRACEMLLSIKVKWNRFRDRVGPIDFECEEGGINIEMDLQSEEVGAPGLPDTLDFWISLDDSEAESDHKNLIKAALLSLVDKVCDVAICSPSFASNIVCMHQNHSPPHHYSTTTAKRFWRSTPASSLVRWTRVTSTRRSPTSCCASTRVWARWCGRTSTATVWYAFLSFPFPFPCPYFTTTTTPAGPMGVDREGDLVRFGTYHPEVDKRVPAGMC